MGRRTINVIVADDNPAVRKAVVEILTRLGKGIRVAAEAGDGEELLTVAVATPADVYVVDIEMPNLSGIEAVERLMKIQPGVRVVILSMYRDRVLVERAFRVGARGYVLKESVTEDIIRAIEEVHDGGRWVSEKIAGFMP